MLLDLVRTIAPTDTPVSLAEIKAHLRVSSASEDALIQPLLDAAVKRLDGYSGILGRALVTQTWGLRLPSFYHHRQPGRHFRPLLCGLTHPAAIRLPLPPLQSVESIAYVDAVGVSQTLDPTAYQVLDGVLSEILPARGTCFPATQCDNPRAVTITFVSGYGDADAFPEPPIVVAIKLLVGHWYANREAVVGVEARDSSTELPIGVSALLAPYRLIPV